MCIFLEGPTICPVIYSGGCYNHYNSAEDENGIVQSLSQRSENNTEIPEVHVKTHSKWRAYFPSFRRASSAKERRIHTGLALPGVEQGPQSKNIQVWLTSCRALPCASRFCPSHREATFMTRPRETWNIVVCPMQLARYLYRRIAQR